MVRIDTNLGSGSGVIFETNASDGSALVITNYHVIEGNSSISVLINDSTSYAGVLLGIDPLRDLAVVRICCDADSQSLPFGEASEVEVGDEVIAIGYALGLQGEATVTRGIVSAIRYDGDSDRWVIQTDAPINPGNSGGALNSRSGKLIGINTFKVETTQSGRPVEGFGFAVSQETVEQALPVLTSESQVALPTLTPNTEAPEGVYTSVRWTPSLGQNRGFVKIVPRCSQGIQC